LPRRGQVAWGALLGAAAALMLLWSAQIGVNLCRPDPHLQALALLQQQPPGTAGQVTDPWFSGPPLDYNNGGAMLRQNQAWRGVHPLRPLFVTGVSASALAVTHPSLYVTTDFDISDGLRGRDPATLEFLSALQAHYRMVGQVGGVPLTLVPWPLGPDWRYPWPQITIWQRNS
jgi:hypothetical protein